MSLLAYVWNAVISRLDWYWTGHVDWMAYNFTLGLLPIALAIPLFRNGAKPTVAWRVGFALFLFLLPYAAYMLTDVIHFHEAVDSALTYRRGVIEFSPLYAIYLTASFILHVVCVRRCSRSVHEITKGAWSQLITWALHVIVVIGIYVGRVARLQAWHPVTDPAFTLDRLAAMITPDMIYIIPGTIALATATWGALEIFDGTVRDLKAIKRELSVSPSG